MSDNSYTKQKGKCKIWLVIVLLLQRLDYRKFLDILNYFVIFATYFITLIDNFSGFDV